MNEGDVLFVDEIHRMARPAEEMLYLAMEDFRVDVVIGKGPGATAIPLEIPPFTLVGATTRTGLLPGPLRDRFGFTGHLEFYEPDELELIVRRSAGLLGVELTDAGAAEIASRSRGTPRIANRLLRRVRDYAQVRADGVVDLEVARRALELYEVDESGLDRLDRAVLDALCTKFGGGPVGISTLAVAVGEERETVEEVAEPFLVRSGLLARTPRGRVATAAAWAHLGLARPAADRAGAVRGLTAGARDGGRYTSPLVGHPVAATHPPSRGFVVQELVSLLPIIGIALLFWLLIIRPQSKRPEGRRATMQSALQPGADVMLTSGVFGTIEADRRRPLAAARSPTA